MSTFAGLADDTPVGDTTTDCVVVGHNDTDFGSFAAAQKKMASYSGAYHEITTNSVLLHGKRLTYMDLLNHGVERAVGVNPALNAYATPSLAVCYLQSYLARRGFVVESVNCFSRDRAELAEQLSRGPRAVAITTTYYVDHAPVIEIVKFIREHAPDVQIIVGGPHIYNQQADLDDTTLEYVLRSLGADIYVMDSQGEHSLGLVLTALRDGGDLSAVPNLAWFDRSGRYTRTARVVEQNDMDENSIDWSRVPADRVRPVAYLRTARSCPFSCSFCNYPTLAGKHVLTGLEPMEAELQHLHQIGTRYLVFIDDTFNVPLPRFKRLLRLMIDRQWNFQWISFFRCSNADEEAFDLMAQSGCMGVFLGIESGDQTILNYMNKFAKVDRYQWGIEQLKARGIMTFVSLICGFPGETRQTVANTLAFVEQTRPTFFNYQLYYHDTRSPIAKRSEEFRIEGAGYNWRHRTMNWRVAADLARQAFRGVSGSIPLSLYNFSIWSIPYLVSQGVSVTDLQAFGQVARELMVAGFDDVPGDTSSQEQRLQTLCAATDLARRVQLNHPLSSRTS